MFCFIKWSWDRIISLMGKSHRSNNDCFDFFLFSFWLHVWSTEEKKTNLKNVVSQFDQNNFLFLFFCFSSPLVLSQDRETEEEETRGRSGEWRNVGGLNPVTSPQCFYHSLPLCLSWLCLHVCHRRAPWTSPRWTVSGMTGEGCRCPPWLVGLKVRIKHSVYGSK